VRGAFAVLLVLIGALLTFPASAAVWEQRVLMDQDAFVGLGQEILQQPAVQERLSQRITEDTEAVAAANGYSFPDTIAGNLARNQAANLTRVVVGQLPQSPIGEQALITAHRAIVAVVDNDNDTLTSANDEIRFDFRPITEQVLATFEQVIPNFPKLTLPPGTGEVVIVEERDVSFAFRAARWFDGAAWYIAALPLIAYAGALLVASNRQMTLFLIGLSALIAAGLRIAIYEGPLQRIVVENVVDDVALRPAARGIYDPIAASLVAQDMVLLVAGIFVIVASIVWWAVQRTGNF
jgi:hypothetical protein